MSDRQARDIVPGNPEPLGASVTANGVNFALWSRNATRVELCLYDETGARELRRLDLPARTGDVWHGLVPGLAPGLSYGYRVHGPYAPREGHRFNPNKLLIDPYAREMTGRFTLHDTQFGHVPGHTEGDLSFDDRDDAPFVPKARILADEAAFDAGAAPRTPWRDAVLYELHVKGYTKLSPFVPEALRGTYAGLASEPAIRHLTDLGVTAVELLPVAAFADEPHLVAKGLTNYWGYNPVAMMAPEPRWAQSDARAELRAAIRKLHEAGLEVILDVVFNHTGEGWHLGPTLSLRGIDNAGYYRLEAGDRSRYTDHAGCGNTLDISRPHVRRLVLDTLRTWVRDYGVDGFRFDLATTLGREGDAAEFSAHAAFFAEVAADPLLSPVKLIAEPWDCGPYGYRVGGFPKGWAEWNDKPRDAIRRFWRGDAGMTGELATRLAGSSDVLSHDRGPLAGINFVAAHDGMRLRDLVTYSGKRNEANGEQNRDGSNDNWSAAYGPEGPSEDAALRATRLRQMKNLAGTLLLAQGVPMLVMGDEAGHSQGGNNNGYCQDGPISWIDWRAIDGEGRELIAFTREMIALRRRFPQLRRETFFTGAVAEGSAFKDVTWLAAHGGEMSDAQWRDPGTRTLGMLLGGVAANERGNPNAPTPDPSPQGGGEKGSPQGEKGSAGNAPLLLLFNAHDGEARFRLPAAPPRHIWSTVIDTARSATFPIVPKVSPAAPGRVSRGRGGGEEEKSVVLAPRSLAVLTVIEDPHSALDDLCDLAGVDRSWHDLEGADHHPSVETKRALLAALGFAVGTPEAEKAALAEARAAPWRDLLPPVIVARRAEGETAAVVAPVVLASEERSRKLTWSLRLEDGSERRGVVEAAALDVIATGGGERTRLALPLPGDLPHGYHALTVETGSRTASATVIVAPRRCWLPDWLEAGGRVWGVAHQLYSLRPESSDADTQVREWGIGDFTALGRLAAAVAARRGAVVGINPLNALSPAKPDDASPYAPSSRVFLNTLYIDVAEAQNSLSALPRGEGRGEGQVQAPTSAVSPVSIDAAPHESFLAAPAPASGPDPLPVASAGRRGEGSVIDYPGVARAKLAALWEVFERFEEAEGKGSAGAIGQAFAAFLAEHGSALSRFAMHQVLEETFGRSPSPTWEPYAEPISPAALVFAKEHARRIRFHCWLQFEADRQLARAADQGLTLGLYGDLAVGIDPHGADVWSEPEAFIRGASFGAPPDPFAAEGQDWGMLAFDPLHLKRSAYKPFRDMLAANMRHARALRLDHVMWLERMFFIPRGSKASDGTYVRYPRDELLAVLALESHRHRCLVVGEDLGTVPLGFRELMEREGLLSYKLMAFERYHDGFFKRPDTYPHLGLATPGSHDWPTLAGWWRGRDIEVRIGLGLLTVEDAAKAQAQRQRDRALMAGALSDQWLLDAAFPAEADIAEERLAELVAAVHRFLARSPAALAMLNLEDLALSTEQVNLPGPLVGYPCWRVRMERSAADILASAAAQASIAAVNGERGVQP